MVSKFFPSISQLSCCLGTGLSITPVLYHANSATPTTIHIENPKEGLLLAGLNPVPLRGQSQGWRAVPIIGSPFRATQGGAAPQRKGVCFPKGVSNMSNSKQQLSLSPQAYLAVL